MAISRIAVLIATLLLAAPLLAQSSPGAPQWRALDDAQRDVLAPLEGDWDAMGEGHRNKWIGIADGFHRLTPDEQARIRERMKRWADLTPEQRERARDQYRALRNLPPEQREQLREQWQQYRALPPEERRAKGQSRSPRGGTESAKFKSAKPESAKINPGK